MRARRISAIPPSLTEQAIELAGSWELFRILVFREVKTRYRQTALGVAWVVLQPLLPALIFAAVFGSFARLPSEGTPYFLFALAGLVIFGLFSNSAARASNAFIRDGQIVSKVYFPRTLLPLAAGCASLVDFVVGLVLVIVLAAATGHLTPFGLFAVPIIAAAALALGLALGLAVAGLSAHYRDFVIAVPFVLQVALYASPIVYSSEVVPANWSGLYALNPLVAVTEAFRAALLGSVAPAWIELGVAAAVGGGFVLAAAAMFNRTVRYLADVL